MNKIHAEVKEIQNSENLNIVTFAYKDSSFKMMSLDLNERVKSGARVIISFKPTAVAIAKNISGELSYSNQLKTKIISLEIGELLCSLKLRFYDVTLESIITTASQKRMNLEPNNEVTALIKSSDLFISELL